MAIWCTQKKKNTTLFFLQKDFARTKGTKKHQKNIKKHKKHQKTEKASKNKKAPRNTKTQPSKSTKRK